MRPEIRAKSPSDFSVKRAEDTLNGVGSPVTVSDAVDV